MRVIFRFLMLMLSVSLISGLMPGCNNPPMIDKIVNPIPDNFVPIKGGTFMMGSPSSEYGREDDEDQHSVTVSSFYMSKGQVTQKEYEEVMGRNPSKFRGADLPVESVSWYDAIEYCNKRSIKEGLTPAYTIAKNKKDPNNLCEFDYVQWSVTWNRKANGYRLPTEAEWEYACRADTTTSFSTGENITTNQANYNGKYPYNSGYKPNGIYLRKTTNAGSFPSNPWGLYDMHGNVWEWCWDWYGRYSMADQQDPVGPASGFSRVWRGGSWVDNGQYIRSAHRSVVMEKGRILISSSRYDYLGFRLVRQ